MGFLFNAGALGLADGTIDWENDTIRCRLVESGDSPDPDATAMTGLGVTGNDQVLGSKDGPTKDDSGDRITYAAGDPTFTAQTLGDPVNKMIIFKFVTDDAGSTPIACVDIEEKTPNGGDIEVQFASGICFYLDNVPA